jgi:SAM-dependent methyltransferase
MAMDCDRYSPIASDVIMTQQEKVRAIVRCLKRAEMPPLAERQLLEIGCGSGRNLQLFLSLGFRPDYLVGNELLEDRVEAARTSLPPQVTLIPGDATELALTDESFDIVVQSTVFTSILDSDFQQKLSRRMWRLVKPGGGVLWYDFTFNNPRNPDVRGVPLFRIRQLFPHAEIKAWRVTLAPPISRLVTRVHPGFYTLFNLFPFLRTHLLCWIKKPENETGNPGNA